MKTGIDTRYFLIFCFSLFASATIAAQELQPYIQEALQNNPNIQAFETRYAIAEEKVKEAQWLPNTEFSAGYFVGKPQTRVGAQRARFSAKQMLPWFGTISTRKKYATSRAETDYMDYVIAKRKLALAVSQSYYNLYGIKAQQAVLEKNIQLLKTYETLALTAVEVNTASAVDVLRIQIRQNELQQRKEVLEEAFQAAQVGFNNLLNRNDNAAVVVPAFAFIPEKDPLLLDSIQVNPELLRYDTMYASVQQAEALNQKQSAPRWGVGIDVVPVEALPAFSFVYRDLDLSANGKDIIMPMVSLSVPLFNKRYASKTKQNELRMQEISLQKMERQNVLEAALAKAVAQRNEARIAFTTQTKNLQQAKDAEQILMKNYETATVDFNELLDIQELQLKFQYQQIGSIQQYFTQAAIINYLIEQ